MENKIQHVTKKKLMEDISRYQQPCSATTYKSIAEKDRNHHKTYANNLFTVLDDYECERDPSMDINSTATAVPNKKIGRKKVSKILHFTNYDHQKICDEQKGQEQSEPNTMMQLQNLYLEQHCPQFYKLVIMDKNSEIFLRKYCQGALFTPSISQEMAETRNVFNVIHKLIAARPKNDAETFAVRNMNNFLKSLLFSRFIPKNKYIMDITCGNRGQDIYKLSYTKPAGVIFVDISENCLMQAEKRWKKNKYPFPATFTHGDFCDPTFINSRELRVYGEDKNRQIGEPRQATLQTIIKTKNGNDLVEAITCQFSAHYAFYSKESAKTFIENIHRTLKRGGIFIGTAPQGESIIKKFNQEADSSKTLHRKGLFMKLQRPCTVDSNTVLEQGWREDIDPGEVENADFDTEHISNLFGFNNEKTSDETTCSDSDAPMKSGIPYKFSLKNTCNCKQYTMLFSDLFNICRKQGMQLLYYKNLKSIADSEVLNPKNNTLIERMKIDQHPLDEEDKEIISMYCAFAFVKL